MEIKRSESVAALYHRGKFQYASVVLLALLSGLTGCTKSSNIVPAIAEKPAQPSAQTTASEPAAALNDARHADVGAEVVDIDANADASTPQASDERVIEAVETSKMWQPSGSWTTRRLIVLSPGGPTPIDLSIRVGQRSLDEASQQILADVTDELLRDAKAPMTWMALLELPLIKSGWLGNLVAAEDQQDQLIAMYDSSKDGIADRDELPPFLSRGLTRTEAVQLTDAGNAPDVDIDASPWGTMDRNNDYSMDQAELAALSSEIMKFDLNGDAVITSQELTDSRGMQVSDSTMTRSMLEVNSVVFVAAESPAPQSRKMASNILRHYTFLESVSRDQWSSWSDAMWAGLDSDGDLQINGKELEGLLALAPAYQVFVQLQGAGETGAEQEYHCLLPKGANATWEANASGGHLSVPGCSTLFQVDDSFSAAGKKLLRNRIEIAMNNSQLKAFFTSQLQLSEGGFALADPDGNLKLDDEEFSRVWNWLAVRQGARIIGRWMVSGKPWFQLADSNGDGRLTEFELASVAEKIKLLDQNGDGRVTPHEMPMVSRFELVRTDTRLAAGPLDAETTQTDEADADWFSAMDANRDGVISRAEFLGSRDDFLAADVDKDGFVSRVEVVSVP
jgi:Ca2+-binding EF-hand superfamily protein